jgi:hypothetical protein
MMTSAADTPSSGWMPVGMPRPLSSTETEPSLRNVGRFACICVPGDGWRRPPIRSELDERFFDTAHGVYSTRTHLATLTYCGPNHPDAPKRGK